MNFELSTWGSIAAIVAGSVTAITASVAITKAICRWSANTKPLINIKCWLQPFGPNNPKYPDIEYRTNDVLISYAKDNPNYSAQVQAKSGKYHLYFEMTPRMPLDVAEMNIRLLGIEANLPRIMGFYDANRKPTREYSTESDGVGGLKLTYNPIRNVFKGKDIYYMATFEAFAAWKGKLSLRFYFVGKEARSVQIPVDIL